MPGRGASQAVLEAVKAPAIVPYAKKTKDAMPERVVPVEVGIAIDLYAEAKQELEKVSAKVAKVMSETEPTILKHARELQDFEGFSGSFSNSYKLIGAQNPAKVIFANRWSIPTAKGPELKELLEKVSDKQLIERKLTLAFKPDIKVDTKKVHDLLATIMGTYFADFFVLIESYQVCENFSSIIYDHVSPEELQQVRAIATQNKPTIKIEPKVEEENETV